MKLDTAFSHGLLGGMGTLQTAPGRLKTDAIALDRQPGEAASHPEQKDPSVIERVPEDYLDDPVTPFRYIAYTSSGRSSDQRWKVARFGANDLHGPWRELESPTLKGMSGPQLCAPAVSYEFRGGEARYRLYIQTACFEPGGVIMEADSADGVTFHGRPRPLLTKDSVKSGRPVIGVYDPSYSRVEVGGRMHDCLTFTGISSMNPRWPHQAKGDIYLMLRERDRRGARWSEPKLVLEMKDISFHNQPEQAEAGACVYEWCPEGTQVIGLDGGHHLMIGVCFLAKGEGCDGERQRVFFAAADSIHGPFVAFALPFEPVEAKGENGHPDTVVDWDNQVLEVILQERGGRLPGGGEAPWGLRHGRVDLRRLRPLMDEAINRRKLGLPDADLTRHLRDGTFPGPATRARADALVTAR